MKFGLHIAGAASVCQREALLEMAALAEDLGVRLHSDGRLDLGVGKGYRTNEFRGFGIDRNQREACLEEGLEILRRAWTEEQFSFAGQFHQLNEVRLMPRPVQQPHPPLWIGARGKKAVERAARLGYHLMGSGEVEGEVERVYDQALHQQGRNPGDYFLAQLRWLYVAESRDRAWEDVEHHLHYLTTATFPLLKEAGDLRRDRAMREPLPLSALRQIDPTIPGGFPIIGTVEDCIRALERYKHETRVTHLALGMHLPGLAPAKLRQSLTRFAREVMPHFQ